MKIVLTGATGLIGSRFVELLFENHQIAPLSSSKGVDITNLSSIANFMSDIDAEAIVHLAAKTDVDGCENDKKQDLQKLGLSEVGIQELDISHVKTDEWSGNSSAFAINTIGTKNLYEFSQERGLKFVQISTDFIFKGEGEYSEESKADPINWYGMTKWLGEKMVDSSKNLTVRLSFPYGYPSPVKPDFVQKLIGFLKERDEVSLIEDQIITPTFIDDIVFGLDFLLQKNATGIYHLSGSSSLSPLVIGEKIKTTFGFHTKINSATREQIYAGKAQRPFQSVMKNDKIKDLGFIPKTFDEGLDLIHKIV